VLDFRRDRNGLERLAAMLRWSALIAPGIGPILVSPRRAREGRTKGNQAKRNGQF